MNQELIHGDRSGSIIGAAIAVLNVIRVICVIRGSKLIRLWRKAALGYIGFQFRISDLNWSVFPSVALEADGGQLVPQLDKASTDHRVKE